MGQGLMATETVLVVDDEEPVRRTFRDWLTEARLGIDVLTAPDAETALTIANERPIDLAILDWNLGAGNDGLQLLEDLYDFNRDIVAIMITGYAHQATPLAAMRMGIRDYLDKNQDLDRDAFLAAVRKQLDRIRPAKRERQLHAGLVAFREAVEKLLPLAQSAAALNDPLSPPEAISSLFRFLLRFTGAIDGVLIVRSYDEKRSPAEEARAYDVEGKALPTPTVAFARSLAGAVFSMGGARNVNKPAEMTVEWQPFERARSCILAAPLPAGEGLQMVLELFDRPGGFREEDRQLVSAASGFGGEVLRHALVERQTNRALLDAVAAALGASDSLSQTLQGSVGQRLQEPPPPAVMERLREGLSGTSTAVPCGEALELAEAIRVLALRHGEGAVRHCIAMVESLRRLLDSAAGVEEARP
jgi:ActR/RegA family two-component response regulator